MAVIKPGKVLKIVAKSLGDEPIDVLGAGDPGGAGVATVFTVPKDGFQPLTRQEAGLLFRLVSYRYEKGSTIITTNKAVKDWPEVLAGDEVMTTALLDRLLHRCHVLHLRGRSYRLRELEAGLQ